MRCCFTIGTSAYRCKYTSESQKRKETLLCPIKMESNSDICETRVSMLEGMIKIAFGQILKCELAPYHVKLI